MAVRLDEGRFETRRGPDETLEAQERRARGEALVDEPRDARERELDARGRETIVRDERGHFASLTYTALRITAGVILAAHGAIKIQDFPAWAETVRSLHMFGMPIPIPTLLAAISVLAELGGGIALVLGLFTRLAALGAFVNMLVAILSVHAGHGLFAANMGFELPLLLLMVSALFVAEGSGAFGLDARLWRAQRERRAALRSRRRAGVGPRYAH